VDKWREGDAHGGKAGQMSGRKWPESTRRGLGGINEKKNTEKGDQSLPHKSAGTLRARGENRTQIGGGGALCRSSGGQTTKNSDPRGEIRDKTGQTAML